ncbi:hypothetical protein PGTUg99_009230 [Puccinia graminis f. sp. tritici]|uniref:Uncharacterized protein n=1 Tax=Puccinia graminis f. sp. tritici TaxID=56615 RepID=A0A5B0SD20_PUCGR|nr:hypothetical protein PGTUg99_009230 [Puccinia graminis f. sp. tritici]
MANEKDPLPKDKRTPGPQSNPSSSQEIPLKRRKFFGVSHSEIASSFFAPPDSNGKRTCLIDDCGDALVANKTTKTNFVNHVACKHPGEWKAALEASENAKDGIETPLSSSPAASQSMPPTSKAKGPLQQIMLKS